MNSFCIRLLESIILLETVSNVVSERTVLGQIKTDTGFYYQKLSKFPSKVATIEYIVWFNKTNIDLHCVKDVKCFVRLDIYTTEHDRNLRTNCSNNVFGQLRNENLNSPLKSGSYRFTTCKLDDVDLDMLHCKGRIPIQDYIPRHYGISFGYHCRELVRPSLLGLSFNFTILRQTNSTTCFKIPKHDKKVFNCQEYYEYTSLPNFIGDLNTHDVHHWMDSSAASAFLGLISSRDGHFCYKYFRELVCRVAYPECDPETEQVVHICRRNCYEFLEACLKRASSILQELSSVLLPFTWRWREPINVRDEVDCDYLPSVNSSVTCFYRPVTCDPPPNVTNARIINGSKPNKTYLAMSQVEYECLDETFQMEGNSTVTCLYSGEWNKNGTLKCLKGKTSSYVNPLSIVIPLLTMPVLIFIIMCIIMKHTCQRKKLLKRNREYDSFLCYNFDEDWNFVCNSILPELEENYDPPLELLIHDRDFIPGQEITINICNAIENSNSAIIVMSQGFIDSPRCREEFTKCVAESGEGSII